jgi:ribonuclease HII
MKNRSTLKFEQKYREQGFDFVIGVDEAGRGPLAGPVVACAAALRTSDVQIQKGHPMSKIQDSKLLSEKQREELYDFICEHFYVGVGICDHKTIDRINILEATYLAMKKAVSDLNKNLHNCYSRESGNLVLDTGFRVKPGMTKKYIILVDGNKTIPHLSIEQKAIVGGDNLVKSISAASIIAKVTRDRMMKKMHKKYPEYCFDKHKGYGTKFHMDMIEKYGPCEIHRRSFRPFH